jgi:hypothetical protein
MVCALLMALTFFPPMVAAAVVAACTAVEATERSTATFIIAVIIANREGVGGQEFVRIFARMTGVVWIE